LRIKLSLRRVVPWYARIKRKEKYGLIILQSSAVRIYKKEKLHAIEIELPPFTTLLKAPQQERW